jgi:hypothetical protein
MLFECDSPQPLQFCVYECQPWVLLLWRVLTLGMRIMLY